MENTKTLIAMSGGVDSAVAALLIKEAGYAASGVTMKLYTPTTTPRDAENISDTNSDIDDARAICRTIGIDHHAVEYSESFCRYVIDNFIEEYKNGGTPNPCVECNRTIKFGKLLDFALSRGYDKLATGHYARVTHLDNGRFAIKRAIDESKDQSYFLWSLSQDALSRVVFPLGELTKDNIRKIAHEHGFVNAHKSDSQDICFVPDGDYVSFIKKNSDASFTKGNFIDPEGNILGEHQGIIRYTVGQRKGLGIALGRPMFVKQKCATANTVTLCDDADLYSRELFATRAVFSSVERLTEPTRLYVKIRYRHTPALATVTQTSDTTFEVLFDEPQRAAAKGQSVVLYDGDIVLGGGIIE